MTRVRLEDLPPSIRRQIEAKAGEAGMVPGGGEGHVRGTRAAPSPGPAYRCVGCDAVFKTYGRFEKHSDESGHHRGEILWAAASST